jgi:ABC-type transporter Mla MlaB component
MSELLMHELPVKDRLVLSGSLTVRDIQLVHARIAAALHQYPSVTLDCAAANAVDLSFIQLVLAARKSAAAAGKTLALARPAEGALRDALKLAGLIASGEDAAVAGQDFWVN